jgi:hypothetical protein
VSKFWLRECPGGPKRAETPGIPADLAARIGESSRFVDAAHSRPALLLSYDGRGETLFATVAA